MKASVIVSIFSLLIAAAAAAQTTSVASACGQQTITFNVKASPAVSPGLDPDKAVVYMIERDLTARTWVTPTTRLGMDGEWLGATHGNSYSFFVVSPGVHHLCADTKFRGVGGGGQAFLHFDAKPGATYFFEVRNTRVGDPYGAELSDVALQQLDEDEAQYLLLMSAFVTSQRKN